MAGLLQGRCLREGGPTRRPSRQINGANIASHRLVSGLVIDFTKWSNLLENRVGDGGPCLGSGVGIAMLDEVVALALQIRHRVERATTDRLVGALAPTIDSAY